MRPFGNVSSRRVLLAFCALLTLHLLVGPSRAEEGDEDEDGDGDDDDGAVELDDELANDPTMKNAWVEEVTKEDGTKKMSFKPPKFTEEEERSYHVPEGYKCDACMAVAYQFHKAFEKEHQKYLKTKGQDFRMSEIDLVDKAETVCKEKTFEVYGIAPTQDIKVNRIKGPGVFDEPGIAQMGGRTPSRLAVFCMSILDEIDEADIYDRWVRYGQVPHALREFLCREETAHCRNRNMDEL